MFEELDKIYCFIKKDIASWSSYKTNIVLIMLNTLFGALSYAFWGANAEMSIVTQLYGMPVLGYLLIGMAFSTYISQSLTVVQKASSPWWLEEVLVSPTRLITFIIGSAAWPLIFNSVVVLTYLGIGIWFFGLVLNVNIMATLVVLALGILSSVGFSMIGAGILIVVKQGDPVSWFMQIFTQLFGNVLFPPEVMPYPLRLVPYFLPQFYFFKCIRLALMGFGIESMIQDLMILLLSCVVILPVGYKVYESCLASAKKNGTLSWF